MAKLRRRRECANVQRQRNIGVVEIQHDLARCTLMRFDEEGDQQRIDLHAVTIDLVIFRRMATSYLRTGRHMNGCAAAVCYRAMRFAE
jgi:hypothetical protein